MRLHATLMIACVVLYAGPTARAEEVLAQSKDEFSGTQGQNNWYYGYYDGSGDGKGDGNVPLGRYTHNDFKPMQYKATQWGYEWAGPVQYLNVTAGGMHPGVLAGRPAWAVRRWVSKVEGKICITGTISRGSDKGDGVNAHILVDGVEVFAKAIGGDQPAKCEYELVVPVRKGALVDFAVDPGKGTETSFDATSFSIAISR